MAPPFNYDYYIGFDDDYKQTDEADVKILDDFLALQPTDVDKEALKAKIILISIDLTNILKSRKGIHHIARVFQLDKYRYELEINNTSWTYPNELLLSTHLPEYLNDDITIYYFPKRIQSIFC